MENSSQSQFFSLFPKGGHVDPLNCVCLATLSQPLIDFTRIGVDVQSIVGKTLGDCEQQCSSLPVNSISKYLSQPCYLGICDPGLTTGRLR